MFLNKLTVQINMLSKKIPAGKIWRSFGVLLILNFSVFAQQWVWKDFSPANSGWRVTAPAPLRPDEEAQKPGSPKGSYVYNDLHGFFAIIYQTYSSWDWFTQKSRFNKQRDLVVTSNNGKLLKDVEYIHRGVKGREVEVKFAAGTISSIEGPSVTKHRVQRFRMFFKGRRFYIILAVLPEDEINKPEIDNYLDSFSVNSEPEAVADSYNTDEDTTLTINSSNGILANDTDAEQDKLSVAGSKVFSQPAHGTLSLNADGSFIYQPNPNFNGSDSFTYKANDGVSDSEDTATVTINIKPVNDAPTISNVPPSLNVDELNPLLFKAVATDIDDPAGSLQFSLTGAPDGAFINPNTGSFSWTATEAQGPGNFSFKVNVSDGKATSSMPINITINEVNVAPVLNDMPPATINELEPYSVSVRATDSDIPAQTLTFSLKGAPKGVSINPATGVINWTPSEAQGDGSNYKFTVSVSDGTATKDANISLNVKEVNTAPTLAPITDQTVDELKMLSLTLNGSDQDLPANTFTYSLESNAPAGMTINPGSGVISWTPSEAQGTGDYSVTVRLTDNGTPQLFDTKTFKVHVNEVNSAPVLNSISDQTIDELKTFSLTASGSDKDLPANNLTYSLEPNAPDGMTIDPKSGQISWTPTEIQGAGDYSVTVRLTDSGTPSLADTKTFKVHVNEVNTAPILAPIGNKSVNEETGLTFNVTATDADLPANSLQYTLVNAPAGASLDTNGRFTWTPAENQGPGTYNLTIRVMDNGTPQLSAEETITIKVEEVNKAPIANNSTFNTDEDKAVSMTLTATDADLPLNHLSYLIVTAPAHGKLGGNGSSFTYTPDPNFNGTETFTFKANDGLVDSNVATVQINIKPVNDSPVANPDAETTNQEVPITINVLTNDTDIDGDKLVLTNVSNARGGKAEIIGNAVKFTPDQGFVGNGSFEYLVSDGNGGAAKGVVTVKINAVKPNP
jgi:VCBS repeat-containing protein